jgi:hypothetical protein
MLPETPDISAINSKKASLMPHKAKNPVTPATILNLPTEIHLEIFSHLNPGASACFGLTCKKFYSIHRSIHGTVSLYTDNYSELAELDLRVYWRLHNSLEDWVGPNSSFDHYKEKFVTRKGIPGRAKKCDG